MSHYRGTFLLFFYEVNLALLELKEGEESLKLSPPYSTFSIDLEEDPAMSATVYPQIRKGRTMQL